VGNPDGAMAFFSGKSLPSGFALFLILLAGFLVYSNVYEVPFVLDDGNRIMENPEIRSAGNYLSFESLTRTRALVDLTFAWNYRFGGLNVFGYHLVNVIIHILNGFLVYALSLSILGRLMPVPSRGNSGPADLLTGDDGSVRLAALFAALIFVVHPVQTQAVTYIVQRYTSLAAFFYLASILFYIRARGLQSGPEGGPVPVAPPETPAGTAGGKKDDWKRGGGSGKKARPPVKEAPGRRSVSDAPRRRSARVWGYFFLSISCAVLAFFSKQNTASLPLAVLLVEYLLFDRSLAGWKKKLLWVAAGGILWMGLLFAVVGGLSGDDRSLGDILGDLSAATKETEVVGRWDYLCTQFNVLVIYVRLLFIPVSQNLDYFYLFRPGFFSGTTPWAFLFLVFLLGLALWSLRRNPVLSFGIFWFFITLSVESSIIPIKDALFEHRLYLAVFGFALALCGSLFSLARVRRPWIILLVSLVVVACGSATLARNHVWRSTESIWRDVLSKSPHNIRAMIQLGLEFMDTGRYGEAREYFSRILERWPDAYEGKYYLAFLALEEGLLGEAESRFTSLLEKTPGDRGSIIGLAETYRKLGDNKKAIKVYREGLKANRGDSKIHALLGERLRAEGRNEEAVAHFSKALRWSPENLDARLALGELLLEAGRFDESEREFRSLIERDPRNGKARAGFGEVLARKGRFDEAEGHLLAAREALPGDGRVLLVLAMTRANGGKYREALESYGEALPLSPESAVFVTYQMARLHALLGEGTAALEGLRRSFEAGLDDPAVPAGDPAWEPFRERKEYRDLLEGIRTGGNR